MTGTLPRPGHHAPAAVFCCAATCRGAAFRTGRFGRPTVDHYRMRHTATTRTEVDSMDRTSYPRGAPAAVVPETPHPLMQRERSGVRRLRDLRADRGALLRYWGISAGDRWADRLAGY